jgi:hypothetical protein
MSAVEFRSVDEPGGRPRPRRDGPGRACWAVLTKDVGDCSCCGELVRTGWVDTTAMSTEQIVLVETRDRVVRTDVSIYSPTARTFQLQIVTADLGSDLFPFSSLLI